MKQISQNELQALYAPVSQTLYAGVHQALTFADEREEKKPVKKKVSTALIIAAVLALISAAAVAAGGSRLLAYLFPTGDVPEAAAMLLNTEVYTVSENGVTLKVTESLFDGSSLLIRAEMTNETDETLYAAIHCDGIDRLPVSGTPAEILARGGGADTIFDYGVFFNRILPGQSVAGNVKYHFSADGEETTTVLEVHVVRALEQAEPVVGDLYAFDTLLEPAGEEIMVLPLTIPVRNTAAVDSAPTFCLAASDYRMADHTLRITELTLAPASAKLSFEIIPDDPADVVFCNDSQPGKLVRSYVIMDDKQQTIPMRMDGWVEDGVLHYVCEGAPFAERPKALSIIPTGQGMPLMDEACTVRLDAE